MGEWMGEDTFADGCEPRMSFRWAVGHKRDRRMFPGQSGMIMIEIFPLASIMRRRFGPAWRVGAREPSPEGWLTEA